MIAFSGILPVLKIPVRRRVEVDESGIGAVIIPDVDVCQADSPIYSAFIHIANDSAPDDLFNR